MFSREIGSAATLLLCLASTASQAVTLPKTRTRADVATTAQPLTARALVRVADIGPIYPEPGQHVFSLSPDGTKAALQVRQADPDTNEYRFQVVVIDISGRASPIIIDQGGEFIRQIVDGVGGATVATGYAAAIPINWSHDGKWVYFLKKTQGKTQIWRASVDGSGSKAFTAEANDVESFVVSSDDLRIVYSTHWSNPVQDRSRQDEARRGFRYDFRFIPLFASGPEAFSTKTVVIKSLDIRTGDTRRASESDLGSFQAYSRHAVAAPSATSIQGRTAMIVSGDASVRGRPQEITVENAGHRTVRCLASACEGAIAIWWTSDGKRVRYIRRGGWGESETSIYEWTPGTERPRRLYSTSDLLIDCQRIGENILCAREQSSMPRHIVALNPATGVARLVYDPNPDFARFTVGRVQRLHWRNAFEIETFGDFVYPVNYKAGHSYPLIVVQYTSRGFLRGGVGDEFPIQAFANRGYAVLSVQRPDARGLIADATTMGEFEHGLMVDFKDRRSVLSSIEIMVKTLIDHGIVDSQKVGITGLSDGSSTVQFAAINSRLFKAASVSGCCWDQFQDAIVGPSAAQAFHEIGWPKLVDYDSAFWSRMLLIPREAAPSFRNEAAPLFRELLAP
jgi:dipeptidyl aminopeptidase/acylaminoacyl peptidase